MIKEDPKPSDEAILNFRMPKAPVGLQVLWYRQGTRDTTSPEVAYMLHAGARTATLHVATTSRRIDAVRHVDDPKLELSPDQRENGAWDYTQEYRALEQFKQNVEGRLKSIEKQLCSAIVQSESASAPKKRGRPKREGLPNHLKEYQALKQRAIELGLDLQFGMKKDEIAAAIEAAGVKDDGTAVIASN